MIYDKLLSLYVNELGRLETNVITATNNIIKTDSSNYALVELIKAKAVEEWHRDYFKQVLDYVKVLEHID
jgi:hypothetical protein